MPVSRMHEYFCTEKPLQNVSGSDQHSWYKMMYKKLHQLGPEDGACCLLCLSAAQ